ncbi:efflux RND transporter permease subunit [Aeromonas simiae]|uniref:efflux RND transporter permease subunit n=1 Tax=Aeromonas simiae TaxID=218936 RepID=UPI00266D95E6|nr:efflux RND transporter permease subunit [Aeromonas simiae]MDO2946905.1 efflux RND transporter permease subunit [Aeromonas simiae]MDO2950517.1 efflux RND transporter permease subunit [Aeromonas simiae]MDO2954501.1 efflux RND transporter permease subunit [Aeromonas simiae]
MWLSDVSVRRPLVALVISALLTVFGLVAFSKLTVREMPDVQTPSVSITTTYEGASPAVMESQVTKPIEDQLSGISGIKNINSMTRKGRSMVTVEFRLGWDMVEGVSDVRDALSRARAKLPDGVDEPLITKDNGNGDVAIWLNFSSDRMDRTALTDYANRVLIDPLSLVDGVSEVMLSGNLERVMYVRLKAAEMAARGLTVDDVKTALARENVELPGGEVRNNSMTVSVQIERLYHTPEDFRALQITLGKDGRPIYLGDIADVNEGAKNEDSAYQRNGKESLGLGIIAQSTANPLAVAQGIEQKLAQMQRFLPEGAKLEVDYDSTVFIEQAILEVYETLAICAVLVVAVLYLFLGQGRTTLIPAITVPVSLISAFIGAWYLGFSINLITLLALILAIGLVVDDAIVVVENIHHHLMQGQPPLLAAWHGTREVGFAVIATTAVLIMVFVPIAFMDGMVGRLFTEFAILLSLAVLCSSLIALTLTPAMGSWLMRAKDKPNRLTGLLDRALVRLEEGYRHLLGASLRRRRWAPLLLVLCLAGMALLYARLPTSLTPTEDRGVVYVFVKGAEGTSIERMKRNMQQVEQAVMPLLGQGGVQSVSFSTPAFGRGGDQTGLAIIQLTDWAEREQTSTEFTRSLTARLGDIPDVMVRAFQPGFRRGSNAAVQFALLGGDYQELFAQAQALQQAAVASGLMTAPDLDYAEKTPELRVSIDRVRAGQLGIPVSQVASSLQTLLGGSSRTTYVDRGEEYDVYLRGDQRDFNGSSDLSRIYLKAASGDMVSLSTLVTLEQVASPQRLNHYQRQKAVTLTADVAAGHTLGEALDFLDRWAAEHLPAGMTVDYNGESKEYRDNQGEMGMVFGLALLVVYLVLVAQFESFIVPGVVMVTVPLGIFGGLLGLWLTGQEMSIYGQIGMIMLIGIVAKNGILIVEFINQLRERGVPFEEAIVRASVRRLRPILMTSLTAIMGAVPLMLSLGAGYESRMAVGTVVFFGLTISTLVTLLLVPAIYALVARHAGVAGERAKAVEAALVAERETP